MLSFFRDLFSGYLNAVFTYGDVIAFIVDFGAERVCRGVIFRGAGGLHFIGKRKYFRGDFGLFFF